MGIYGWFVLWLKALNRLLPNSGEGEVMPRQSLQVAVDDMSHTCRFRPMNN